MLVEHLAVTIYRFQSRSLPDSPVRLRERNWTEMVGTLRSWIGRASSTCWRLPPKPRYTENVVEPLTTDLLRTAYLQGIFPMGLDDGEIGWFRSDPRAIFEIATNRSEPLRTGFHVSRSLRKRIANCGWRISFDESFEEVMQSCLRPGDNWITPELIQIYCQAHAEGWAHSCEVWDDHDLIGGVYGLAVGGCFCAESMFHRRTDASKVALWALIQRCIEMGFTLFDAQVMNPHLSSLGAREITLAEYLQRLEVAVGMTTEWSRG